MRLFIAIQLDPEMKEELTDLQLYMKGLGVRGNYSREENLHLTLAFIGEYSDPDAVLDIIDQISFEPFRLSLDGIGSFRNLWWAGLEESAALRSVVKRLRRALSDAGIPFDRKKFSPHITLIRRPSQPAIPEELL